MSHLQRMEDLWAKFYLVLIYFPQTTFFELILPDYKRLSHWTLVRNREAVDYYNLIQYFENWYFSRIHTLPCIIWSIYSFRYNWSFYFYLKRIINNYTNVTPINFNQISYMHFLVHCQVKIAHLLINMLVSQNFTNLA